MVVKLYYILGSPPARAVLFGLKALDIPHELQTVNLFKGELFSEEFLKLNPQHTIPILVDNGHPIWDSHAINAYLVSVYGKDDSLYPKDPKKRAVVDQRLHFDSGVLFPTIRNTTISLVVEKTATSITESLKKPIISGYEFLEKFLDKSKFIASDDVTIADFSVVTSLATMMVLVPITETGTYPLIQAYINRCKETIPGYEEINEKGVEQYRELIESVVPLPSSSY